MLLSDILPAIETARRNVVRGRFVEAQLTYSAAIDTVEAELPLRTGPSLAQLRELRSGLKKEVDQLRRTMSALETLSDVVKNAQPSPENPPADPGVWPDPPNRRSSSTARNRSVKGRGAQNSVGVHATRKSCTTGSSSAPMGRQQTEHRHLELEQNQEADASNVDFNPNDLFVSRGYEREMVSIIASTMTRDGHKLGWGSIAGLENAKEIFKQTILLPTLIPDFFKGIRRPCRGICMVGPPGTGKTMLAKAVAAECKSTFFVVNPGDLASKWRGDSEKLIKLLFEMARHYSPSTVFIDEIDAIGVQRGAANEHEASRRLKSQLLIEMDGFAGNDAGPKVLVIAATNFPWMLDEALRRRFEKRIYIPLPELQARFDLIQDCLKEVSLADDISIIEIAKLLSGYSGADIVNVCREAALQELAKLTKGLNTEEILKLAERDFQPPPVTMKNFEEAIRLTSPSVNQECLEKFEDWMKRFGSG